MLLLLIYFLASFLIAICSAYPIIAMLRRFKSKQVFRELGPQSHIQTKSGTPTMGAWIFLIPVVILSLYLFFKNSNQELLLVIFALISGAILGAIDDGLKIFKSNYKGLDSRYKLLIQLLVTAIITYGSGRYLFSSILGDGMPSWIAFGLELIWAFCVIAGASNAMNLTDGLDGLATVLSICAFGACSWYFYLQGNFSLLIFASILVAALAAFLVFNFHPAKVFMGDTGSLALGMSLGAIAYVEKIEWYLFVFALIPILETISVILQVASSQISRRFFGKDWRIFKMAPLHHHLEFCGLKEVQIFWLFAFIQFLIIVTFFIFNDNLPKITL